MKTKEELNTLRNEVEALNKKLAELTEEELQQIVGGTVPLHNMPQKADDEKYVMGFAPPTNGTIYNPHIYTEPLKEDFEPKFDK